MQINIIFNNLKDKELFDLFDLTTPYFVEYIDVNTTKGKKEGYKLLNYYGSKKLPFVVLNNNEDKKIFYSDSGSNAIVQLINYFKNENRS
jgi:hypothetical protein